MHKLFPLNRSGFVCLFLTAVLFFTPFIVHDHHGYISSYDAIQVYQPGNDVEVYERPAYKLKFFTNHDQACMDIEICRGSFYRYFFEESFNPTLSIHLPNVSRAPPEVPSV